MQSNPSMEQQNELSLQNKKLDHELFLLEREDEHQKKEIQSQIAGYQNELKELRQQNKLIEKELITNARIHNFDPMNNEFTAMELTKFHEEGNAYIRKIEIKRKQKKDLDSSILDYEMRLEQLKTHAVGGLQAAQGQAAMTARIRKMEVELDRKMIHLNEKRSLNKRSRETIDHLRRERASMDEIYTDIEMHAFQTKKKTGNVEKRITACQDEIEQTHAQIKSLQEQALTSQQAYEEDITSRMELLQSETQEPESAVKGQWAKTIKLQNRLREMKSGSRSILEEKITKARYTRGKWRMFQSKVQTDVVETKYHRNREFIDKMYLASGTSNAQDLVDVFLHQERDYFGRITQINHMAHDLKEYRAHCAQLRDQIAQLNGEAGASLSSSGPNTTSTSRSTSNGDQLETQIADIKAQCQAMEEATNEHNQRHAAIRSAFEGFHERIGASSNSDNRLPGGLKKSLGEIEARIVMILQQHTKNEVHEVSDLGDLLNDPMASPNPNQTINVAQPYRYTAVKPPTLHKAELKQHVSGGDTAEDEYALTYGELKSEVWETEGLAKSKQQQNKGTAVIKEPTGWRKLSIISNSNHQ